ncbi:2'-5' RNA ligase family protein [Paenibacillus ginsengihumi]|uniref:2'-5' RNA ligase family protein n=1 Tax=Paenibacillus ginsengihumi TaxID=431596 RepID=UPI000382A164|nr:2'-5' RNA ligase family protein [Paenibacillus ginsengihumi]
MQYGIAVFPPEEIRDFANHYRKRYDPHYPFIAPHLTVRETELWSQEKRKEAEAHLERAAAQTPPLKLRFNRFSSFYPVNHTVYLALADPGPMLELYRRVCSGPLVETGKPYVYTPHLTVAQRLTADEMHDVLASLRHKPIDLAFTADRMELLGRENDDSPWQSVRTFLFEG